MVGILFSATNFESMKQSVEPESNKESKSIVVKVSIGFSVTKSVDKEMRKALFGSERADAFSVISPALVQTRSTQLLLRTGVQELRTIFLPSDPAEDLMPE